MMNAIQEERMKGYFLSAAKELIRGEGLKVMSSRNVAERAGYSYATLYNYFKDMRDLVFSCVEDFMQECKEFVTKDLAETTGTKAITIITNNYVKFFVQYPGIFDLFYQEKVNQISTKNSNVSSIDSLFDSLIKAEWQVLKNQSGLSDLIVAQSQELHKLALHGLLMLYLNRRKDLNYKELMNRVDEITQFFIKAIEIS
jgi:AcrR family transcriptional regulator